MLDVRKLLAQRPLLFDGGMGTYYKAKPGQECEQANLTDPEGILAVHRAYLAAGADAIKTNTFSLPRLAAAQQPGWEQLADAGWQLAVKAAGETGAAVFADLGPAPDTENLPAEQVYLAVAKRFALLGARNFLFETLSAEDGVLEAIRALKQTVPEAFVLVSFAVLPDGYTREGRYCAELVRRVAQSGVVDAVGLNCVSAPGAMRALVQQLGDAGLPLSVMPNAGYPVVARAQVRYQGKPEYFARELSRLASEGVRILGGCCGTTPQHIAALRTALDAYSYIFEKYNFVSYFFHSLLVSLGSTFVSLLIYSMAGYALSKFRFPGRNLLFTLFTITLLVPATAKAQPIFSLIVRMGLINTLSGLSMVYVSSGMAMSLFILRAAFLSVPKELDESARLDGAGFFRTFWKINLPLARSGMATAGILMFLNNWNEYFYASMLTHTDSARTMPVALQFFNESFSYDYTKMFAALTLVIVPGIILYLFMQKQVQQSLASTGLKG